MKNCSDSPFEILHSKFFIRFRPWQKRQPSERPPHPPPAPAPQNLAPPTPPPSPPMEAKRVDRVPTGDKWLFEPKWDGFRAIVFRSGDTIAVQSKAGQPLGRYFPQI